MRDLGDTPRFVRGGDVAAKVARDAHDLVLAGMDRFAVRTGDQLLAGEPVGAMPVGANRRLYFEVRQNGKSFSPAPWLDADLKPDLRKAKKS